MSENHCSICGATGVRSFVVDQSFVYGEGDDGVELSAQVEVYSCSSCGLKYTDAEGEDRRNAAVLNHLEEDMTDEEKP